MTDRYRHLLEGQETEAGGRRFRLRPAGRLLQHGSDHEVSVPDSDFNWTGFFRPIENIDADGNYVLNLVKAGQGVPVKFSLAGDQGPAIFAEGYPKSSQIACDTGAEVNAATKR